MLIRIKAAGSKGVNKDMAEHELPMGVWTDANNIRFLDGSCVQAYGYSSLYGSPRDTPEHILSTGDTTIPWIYMGGNSMYAIEDSSGYTHHSIGGGIATVDVGSWTSCLLGGVPIFNNGTDYPLYWGFDTSTSIATLTNWQTGTHCKSMRNYKNFLIALNVSKTSGATTSEYPFMVKWSHPAEPGSLPVTWDESDANHDAGELDLAEGYDHIVDGLTLRDSFMIYKKASVWRMDYTGGSYIFKVAKVLGNSGVLARNCVIEVEGAHIVFGQDDIYMHDGQKQQSLLDKQTRRFLYGDIDYDATDSAFVFGNRFYNEVYFCYATVGNTIPDKALIWNYRDKTITFSSMPDVYHAAQGYVSSDASSTWAADDLSWDSDATKWDANSNLPDMSRVILASSDGAVGTLYLMDNSPLIDGEVVGGHITRIGMDFGEAEQRVVVKSVRPRIQGESGATVKVSVGYSDTPEGDPTYTEMTHTIGTTVADSCLVEGRYIAVKFETGTANRWQLDSFDIEYEPVGYW